MGPTVAVTKEDIVTNVGPSAERMVDVVFVNPREAEVGNGLPPVPTEVAAVGPNAKVEFLKVGATRKPLDEDGNGLPAIVVGDSLELVVATIVPGTEELRGEKEYACPKRLEEAEVEIAPVPAKKLVL